MMWHQAARPSGLIGKLLGHLMVASNRTANRRALELLEPTSRQKILEIGFGPGDLIQLMTRKNDRLKVYGLEVSGEMLAMATRRNVEAIAAGRVSLALGSIERLPFADDELDAVAAVHNFQFWPDPRRALTEIRRALTPAGRLVLVLRLHSQFRWRLDLPNPYSRSGDEIQRAAELLTESGFDQVHVESGAGHLSDALVAMRSPATTIAPRAVPNLLSIE